MKLKRWIEPNKELITVVQLLWPLAIYFAVTANAEWYWWVASFVFYFFYCAIGNNLAMHRYFCHKHFELSKPMEYFFLWCSSMSTLGSPLSYAIPHLVHHKHPDSDQDPHGPTAGLKSILYYFHRHLHINEKTIISRRVFELAKQYCWLHRNYWLFVTANLIVFALLGWKVFVFCWFLPATTTLWAVSIAIYLQHWPKGSASNNHLYAWFGWGESLHANHHVLPGSSNTAINPGEFDYTHWLAKLFAKRFY
jgi:stearoyl-CoA desaturase (delta-9 desaturase)